MNSKIEKQLNGDILNHFPYFQTILIFYELGFKKRAETIPKNIFSKDKVIKENKILSIEEIMNNNNKSF